MKKTFSLLVLFCILFTGCSKEELGNDSGLPVPAGNEIYYTTTDGLMLDFQDGSWQNSWYRTMVVSHTVKKDSIFVLTFVKDIDAIESDQFVSQERLKSISLPNTVAIIKTRAFKNCTSLINVNIPNSVLEIGGCAFEDCTSLNKVKIPNNVTKIGFAAFEGCESITSINIPKSVTEIGVRAFTYMKGLYKFEGKFASKDGRCLIKDSVLIAFAPMGLTEYSIQKDVKSIGMNAMTHKNLTSITIPESVTEIGYDAFRGSNITSIVIPESVSVIYNGAFYKCI